MGWSRHKSFRTEFSNRASDPNYTTGVRYLYKERIGRVHAMLPQCDFSHCGPNNTYPFAAWNLRSALKLVIFTRKKAKWFIFSGETEYLCEHRPTLARCISSSNQDTAQNASKCAKQHLVPYRSGDLCFIFVVAIGLGVGKRLGSSTQACMRLSSTAHA